MADLINEDVYTALATILSNEGYTVNEYGTWYDEQKAGTQVVLLHINEIFEELDTTHQHLRNKFHFMIVITAETRAERFTAYRGIKTILMDKTKMSNLCSGKVEIALLKNDFTNNVTDQELDLQGKYFYTSLEIVILSREDYSS